MEGCKTAWVKNIFTKFGTENIDLYSAIKQANIPDIVYQLPDNAKGFLNAKCKTNLLKTQNNMSANLNSNLNQSTLAKTF